MSEIKTRDYAQLGLKVGLEIHQQLDTKKLFCNCLSMMRDDVPDKTIKRFLRASAGETGTVDIAAKHESEKKKYFIYEYYDDTCLVELDEEPPHAVNADALQIVLQVSAMMRAKPVDQIHFMRKTVVDGSNTSGFQRTAFIASNGALDFDFGQVGVETICLEEDAARIISRETERDIYRLDRLGVPLIEIATAPDMKTPKQAKETAAFIGMLLRSTGRVKRGLGTIRQDVNVSILGGVRVEIKGVQDLRLLDKVVDFEVTRQLKMQELRSKLQNTILPKDKEHIIHAKPQEVTVLFENTTSTLIKKGLSAGNKIYAKAYPHFQGIFGFEVNPNRRFGTELSDRIKAFGLNGLIHTDENLEKYQITNEVAQFYQTNNLSPHDGVIFIIGDEEKCVVAFKKIDATIIDFIENGLSKEVRNAKDDATSSFLRPMPGSSRMYPETDVLEITPDLSAIKQPELIKDKIVRFEKQYGLAPQVAKDVVFTDFELSVAKYPQIKPIIIAETFSSYPKEIKTLHNIDIDVSLYADLVFAQLNNGTIESSSVKQIFIEIAKGSSVESALEKFKTVSEDEVAMHISDLIAKHPNLTPAALMGEVMKTYRGKFSGQKIQELIKKFKG